MSAALTRSKKLDQVTNELNQPSESIPGKLEAQTVAEVTRFTGLDSVPVSDHGMTPLMRAAGEGLAGTVQALLDRGAEVNARRADGFNALALAAFFGHSQVVWLLLESGADLDPTGRAETLPETWANVRGYLDIGEILREARAARQIEVASPRNALIDEPARFPRPAEPAETAEPAEKEPLNLCVDPIAVQDSISEEARDSEITSPAPVVQESAERKSESSADPAESLPDNQLELAQQQPVIQQPLQPLKTLPEIEDPPPLVVPEFHPVSVFVGRISSSRISVVALLLLALLVYGGVAAFLIPQIKSPGNVQTEAVTKTTAVPKEPGNPAKGSGTNVAGTVETPSAGPIQSTTSPASHDIVPPSADSKPVESTPPIEAAEVSAESSAGIATSNGSKSRGHIRSANKAPELFESSGEFSITTSTSRSASPARKKRLVSRDLKLKQQTEPEEIPKPAPLSVESTRDRSSVSAPARRTNEVTSSQSPPLSITSEKPKSKVIQWP